MRIKVAIAVFVMIASLLGYSYYFLNKELSVFDLKTAWPQKFHKNIILNEGVTHIEHIKHSNASLTIFVHGVSGPMTAWDKTVTTLKKTNLNFLRYDLYGRGFSERMERDYTIDLYVRQLKALVDKFAENKPVKLVGSSFGCVIISHFSVLYPKLVERIVFIGPAGFPIRIPLLAKLRDAPLLGDALFYFFGNSTILRQNKKYFVSDSVWDQYKKYYKDQLSIKGSTHSMLSTMRHSPVTDNIDNYRVLGLLNIPTWVIWGKEDVTFPYKNSKTLEKLIPHMELNSVDKSAHLPQYESPNIVTPLILKALTKKLL